MRLCCGAVVEMKNKGKIEGNKLSLDNIQNSERVRRVNIGKVDTVSMVDDYIHLYIYMSVQESPAGAWVGGGQLLQGWGH